MNRRDRARCAVCGHVTTGDPVWRSQPRAVLFLDVIAGGLCRWCRERFDLPPADVDDAGRVDAEALALLRELTPAGRVVFERVVRLLLARQR